MNELVPADDDPTAELEILDMRDIDSDEDAEASATTSGYVQAGASTKFQNGTNAPQTRYTLSRSEAVDKLQFDLEVLRAKWQGLTTEIEAREEQANRLNNELNVAKQALQRSDETIAGRDEKIGALESSISDRDASYRSLADELAALNLEITVNGPNDLQQKDQMLELMSGQLASGDLENREMRIRVARVEEYADQIRYQLRVKGAEAGDLSNQVEALSQQLASAERQLTALRTDLKDSEQNNTDLKDSITSLHDTHAEEIRMIRFELGDAQETLTQHEEVTEQLASDLVQNRGLREELENKLAEIRKSHKEKIAALEKKNKRLRLESESMAEQLHSKGEAINSLLNELANSPPAVEPLAEIQDAIHEIDERISEHVDDRPNAEADRVTRLLVGHFDKQELRFPLFKDRLTIGRTQHNDIQLKAAHVSRRHAVVVIEGDVTRVIDWGSKNGVYVNSHRIKEHFLKNGDVVGVGTAEFRYEERPKRDG